MYRCAVLLVCASLLTACGVKVGGSKFYPSTAPVGSSAAPTASASASPSVSPTIGAIASPTPAPTPAPATVSGAVVDASSNAPIVGTFILLSDNQNPNAPAMTTNANAQGVYVFKGVLPSTYTVSAIQTGYKSGFVNVTITSATTTLPTLALQKSP